MSQIESTYKALDVEETIDIWFYRPVGYYIATGCQKFGITPNVVTIISIFIGVAGGHLLYYQDFMTNLWGIILWVIADTLDSVDGQLGFDKADIVMSGPVDAAAARQTKVIAERIANQ